VCNAPAMGTSFISEVKSLQHHYLGIHILWWIFTRSTEYEVFYCPHYTTAPHSSPPLYVVATCNAFVSRSGPVTLQTDRVHIHYKQSVALRSYHQFRLIQDQALVHRNIYCDDSSSGLCLYAVTHLCPTQYVSSPS